MNTPSKPEPKESCNRCRQMFPVRGDRALLRLVLDRLHIRLCRFCAADVVGELAQQLKN